MDRFVLASNNTSKITELEALLQAANLPMRPLSQRGFNISDAAETGLSFIENAIIKARHAARISGLPALADDSGLCVPLLGGAPGIYSARYAGLHGNDAANNAKLLAELLPLRPSNEVVDAMFVCVLAFVTHGDDPLPKIYQGLWQGAIATKPMGENGFGYDPLFWLPALGCTSAQLSASQKNTLSHRAQALSAFVADMGRG